MISICLTNIDRNSQLYIELKSTWLSSNQFINRSKISDTKEKSRTAQNNDDVKLKSPYKMMWLFLLSNVQMYIINNLVNLTKLFFTINLLNRSKSVVNINNNMLFLIVHCRKNHITLTVPFCDVTTFISPKIALYF